MKLSTASPLVRALALGAALGAGLVGPTLASAHTAQSRGKGTKITISPLITVFPSPFVPKTLRLLSASPTTSLTFNIEGVYYLHYASRTKRIWERVGEDASFALVRLQQRNYSLQAEELVSEFWRVSRRFLYLNPRLPSACSKVLSQNI